MLLAALVPLGVAVLTRVGYSPWAALGGALVVATHPSLFTYAHLAFSENLFVPLQAFVLLALLSLVANRSTIAALGLGVALAASAFVRFNAVATVAAGVSVLGVLALRRESRRSAGIGLAAFAAAGAGFTELGARLLPGFRAYGGVSRTGGFISAMAHPVVFVQTVVGQFVSISLSSRLLLPALLAVAVRRAIRRVIRPGEALEVREAGVVCAAAATVGTLLMSALLLHAQPNFEVGIYARYGEGLLPFIIWAWRPCAEGSCPDSSFCRLSSVSCRWPSLSGRSANTPPRRWSRPRCCSIPSTCGDCAAFLC